MGTNVSSDEAPTPTVARAGAVRPPAGRYGPPPRSSHRFAAVVAVALLALGGLTWVVWAGLHHAQPPVRAALLSYRVTSDRSVEVSVEIVKQPGNRATCLLRARNRAGEEVGRKNLSVPADTHRVQITEQLKTSDTPVTGEIMDCRLEALKDTAGSVG